MQTHASPHLKWLLVERATIVGDIAELERMQAVLSKELTKRRKARDALDVSLQILDDRIRADAAGSIHAHKPQYGVRGLLKTYIWGLLRTTPKGLRSIELARMAIAHFGLPIVTSAEVRRYKENSVRTSLSSLRRDGLIECIVEPGDSGNVIWRWKTDLPALGDLAERCHLNGN